MESFQKFEDGKGESVIRIAPVQWDTAGVYTCTAKNDFGQDSFTFTVHVEKDWTVTYVACGVSVAVIACMGILVAYILKKRKSSISKVNTNILGFD